jgi:dienelactone hydrolase
MGAYDCRRERSRHDVLRSRQPAADPAHRRRRARFERAHAHRRRRQPLLGVRGAGRRAERGGHARAARRSRSARLLRGPGAAVRRAWHRRHRDRLLRADGRHRSPRGRLRVRIARPPADLTAAATYIRSETGGNVQTLFTTGFCIGGRISFLASTLGLDFAGVVGFYGWPVGIHRSNTPAPADVAEQIASPLLGLFGGADDAIPLHAIETFEASLKVAGVESRVITYPGAPHGFFDKKADEYSRTSEAAWAEVMGFVRQRTVDPRSEAAPT